MVRVLQGKKKKKKELFHVKRNENSGCERSNNSWKIFFFKKWQGSWRWEVIETKTRRDYTLGAEEEMIPSLCCMVYERHLSSITTEIASYKKPWSRAVELHLYRSLYKFYRFKKNNYEKLKQNASQSKNTKMFFLRLYLIYTMIRFNELRKQALFSFSVKTLTSTVLE